MADSVYERGRAVRGEVLGAAHVERSLANASEFARPMQELVTEYCWGAVWSRPGLERRDRSLINLAMLTALNRSHELAVHVARRARRTAAPSPRSRRRSCRRRSTAACRPRWRRSASPRRRSKHGVERQSRPTHAP